MKYLLIIGILFTSYTSRCQEIKPFADSGIVYRAFYEGTSTASLWSYSVSLDTSTTTRKVVLDSLQLDTLNYLISSVNSRRHFQRKVGRCYFARIIRGDNEIEVAVMPTRGIIDLNNKREYIFQNTLVYDVFTRWVAVNYR